jgi:hypothetical protein
MHCRHLAATDGKSRRPGANETTRSSRCAAAAWPVAVRAQQSLRIGVMIALPGGYPELKK